MGISAGELSVQRRNTAAFVAADSFPCVLQRRPRTPNGSGGYVLGAPANRPVQRLRLMPQSDLTTERQTADGVAVLPTYALLGMHTADIQRHDTFTKDGRRYEVVWVVENQQYQRKAEVFCHG